MKKRLLNSAYLGCLFFILSCIGCSAEFNACDYGAISDGKAVCTEAIQKTIDACSKAGRWDGRLFARHLSDGLNFSQRQGQPSCGQGSCPQGR